MRFGDFTAVHATNLTVRAGEFFSILGPSGCGKTTLLRTISGFLEPTSGDVKIGGRSMLGVGPQARPTALIRLSALRCEPRTTICAVASPNVVLASAVHTAIADLAARHSDELSLATRNDLDVPNDEGVIDRDAGKGQQFVALFRNELHPDLSDIQHSCTSC